MKKLLECEKAYLAGFLDGDGCINAQIIRRSDYILKFQIRVSISFFQKTQRKWFFMKLHKKIGVGILRDRPDKISEYTITGIFNVQKLLILLYPYLQLKKPQAKLLIKIIQKMPKIKHDPQAFIKLCELVDRFVLLNDSKKRKVLAQTVRSKLGLNISHPRRD